MFVSRKELRTSFLAMAFVLCGSWVWPHPAFAIEGWNVSLVGGYAWENVEDDERSTDDRERFLPETSNANGTIGGTFTLPIVRALGLRASAIGILGETERDSAAGFPGNDFDREGVDVTAELFLRNPDFGHFDIGYRFHWDEPDGTSLERDTSHGAVVSAGLYVPDQGMGLVDWDVTAHFASGERKYTSGTDAFDEYGVAAEIAYYAGRSVRVAGGAGWRIVDPDHADETEDLRGTGTISWLMPFEIASRRFATLDLSGSYGRVRTKLGGGFSEAEQRVWSAGIQLVFDYPGANTIVELIRERR